MPNGLVKAGKVPTMSKPQVLVHWARSLEVHAMCDFTSPFCVYVLHVPEGQTLPPGTEASVWVLAQGMQACPLTSKGAAGISPGHDVSRHQ